MCWECVVQRLGMSRMCWSVALNVFTNELYYWLFCWLIRGRDIPDKILSERSSCYDVVLCLITVDQIEFFHDVCCCHVHQSLTLRALAPLLGALWYLCFILKGVPRRLPRSRGYCYNKTNCHPREKTKVFQVVFLLMMVNCLTLRMLLPILFLHPKS